MIRKIALGLALSTLTAASLAAVNPATLDKAKLTRAGLYMTATDANAHMLKHGAKTLFLDVRTRAEVSFLGMPLVADANVPYVEFNEWYAWDDAKKEFKLDMNSEFAAEVERRLTAKGLGKGDTVILMCRSGHRSSKAADLLTGLGYKNVYTMVDGYEGDKAADGARKGQRVVNGWRNADLPWSYGLDKAKMYKVSR
ncbi:MAG: rhodanese-like domain-containing protein [Gammaproteobacteria bacterium]|nr:rhodanese-like domain-containing protein [Gammaproteobacteria bacterium]